jgi:membrane protease YdiL (CAAX protease family)
MEPEPVSSQPQAAPKRFPWVDLLVYLLGGFGVFSLASIVLGFIMQNASIWDTAAVALINFLFIGGSAYYLGVLRHKTSWKTIGIFPINWKWAWLPIAFLVSIALMPIRGLIGVIVSLLVEGGFNSLQARADLLMGGSMSFSLAGFAITFVAVAVIVPISEELYFRGLLHRLFQPYFKFWPRVLLSSSLFALAHFDSIGVVVSSFIMVVVIAYAYEKVNSLWMPIAIHATTNGVAVILLYGLLFLQNTVFSNLTLMLH